MGQVKWLKAIKAQTKLQDLHFLADAEHDDILWNSTDKIFEYYWESDGLTNKSVHGKFSCHEMYQRYKTYFVKAVEPIMFKKVEDKIWLNSDESDLIEEL